MANAADHARELIHRTIRTVPADALTPAITDVERADARELYDCEGLPDGTEPVATERAAEAAALVLIHVVRQGG